MSLREVIKQSLSSEVAPRRKKRTQQQTLHALALFLLVRLIKGIRTSLRDCADEVGHKSTNAIGTALGRGTGGSGGANAWVFNGEVVQCQENVAIFMKFLSDEEELALLDRLGMSEEVFLEKANALPTGRLVLHIND